MFQVLCQIRQPQKEGHRHTNTKQCVKTVLETCAGNLLICPEWTQYTIPDKGKAFDNSLGISWSHSTEEERQAIPGKVNLCAR